MYNNIYSKIIMKKKEKEKYLQKTSYYYSLIHNNKHPPSPTHTYTHKRNRAWHKYALHWNKHNKR